MFIVADLVSLSDCISVNSSVKTYPIIVQADPGVLIDEERVVELPTRGDNLINFFR